MSDPGTKSVGYPLYFFSGGSHNPAASTTYYFGASPNIPATVTTSIYRVAIPYPGIVRWLAFMAIITSSVGSGEPGTIGIEVNSTSLFQLSNTFTWSAASGFNQFKMDYSPGISPTLALEQDDFVEFVVVTPAWVTAPAGVLYSAMLWLER